MGDLPEYYQMTEEDLLVALAKELYGQNVDSFGPTDARRHMEDAREWLQRWVSRKRQNICQELARRGFDSSAKIDAIVDTAVVTDAIITTGLGRPSATIVAALIFKWGLRDLCAFE